MISYPLEVRRAMSRIIESGKGDAVLFIHGVTAYAHRWSRNLDAFAAAGYRACALDLPGHGFATKGASLDHSVPAYADFVDDVIEATGASPAVLVGTSLGGHVAAMLASRRPERVRALVLVGSLGLVPVGAQIRQAMAAAILNTSRDGLRAKLARAHADPSLVTDEWVEEEFRINNSAGARETFERLGAYIAERLDDDCVGAAVASLAQRMPILLVWGEQDRSVPISVAAAAHAVLPSARLVVIRDAGHAPYFERPDAFNSTVQAFLAGAFDQSSPREVIYR